jgi:hypothetical protein
MSRHTYGGFRMLEQGGSPNRRTFPCTAEHDHDIAFRRTIPHPSQLYLPILGTRVISLTSALLPTYLRRFLLPIYGAPKIDGKGGWHADRLADPHPFAAGTPCCSPLALAK